MAISKTSKDQIPETYIANAQAIFAKTEIKASQKNISIIAKCLQRYGKTPETAATIADQLGEIAINKKSETAVANAIGKISKAKTPKEAVRIAKELAKQAKK